MNKKEPNPQPDADSAAIADLKRAVEELVLHRKQPGEGIMIEARQLAQQWIVPGVTRISCANHKTRLAAITLELAYTEGRPVERQLTVNASSEDFATMLERFRQIEDGESLQKTVQRVTRAPGKMRRQQGKKPRTRQDNFTLL